MPRKKQGYADESFRTQGSIAKTSHASDIEIDIRIPLEKREDNLWPKRDTMDLFRTKTS
jgi:hypothetical protein